MYFLHYYIVNSLILLFLSYIFYNRVLYYLDLAFILSRIKYIKTKYFKAYCDSPIYVPLKIEKYI